MTVWRLPFDGELKPYEEGQQFGQTGYERPPGSGLYFHNGYDFGTAKYSGRFKAITAGKIIEVSDGRGQGLGAVILLKAGDYTIVYQEFSTSVEDSLVSVGDTVTSGQEIGYLNPNRSSHLHLGITKKDFNTALGSSFTDDGTWLSPIQTINDSPSTGESGGDGGDDDGGDNGGGGTTPTPKVMQMMRINRFMFPKASKKFVQFNYEDIDEAYPKYHLLRKTLNDVMQKTYPETIEYINSLQGEYGLEKLCCAPTMTITLTNGKGVQKNYNLADFNNQTKLFSVFLKGFLGKSNRLEFYFENYLNYHDMHEEAPLIEAAARKDSLMDQTPKNFDLFIDLEKSNEYLNQNRIRQSMDNASFALSQNQITAANSERNFKLDQDRQSQINQISQTGARKQQDITQAGNWRQFGLNQIGGGLSGLLGIGANMMGGNYAGAGLQALNLGIGAGMGYLGQSLTHDIQNQTMAAGQATQNQALAANQGTNEAIFMNSLSTSNLIASNNYENTIANINAGLADLKNQPDISAVSGSDYNFEMGYDNDDIYCIIYTTHPQALAMIATFYAQFGYSIKKFDKVDDYLRVRTKFNYVKTQGINVRGRINNKWRNALNMIFDNGITFWRDTEQMENNDITGNL